MNYERLVNRSQTAKLPTLIVCSISILVVVTLQVQWLMAVSKAKVRGTDVDANLDTQLITATCVGICALVATVLLRLAVYVSVGCNGRRFDAKWFTPALPAPRRG